jgi:hypothetical protein
MGGIARDMCSEKRNRGYVLRSIETRHAHYTAKAIISWTKS